MTEEYVKIYCDRCGKKHLLERHASQTVSRVAAFPTLKDGA